ncbi:isochorismatase family protein [Nocardioides sp. B-3]|uniref:isochorismatase family protein n=1 Tax=Nocardioides sp. B-3 TaxID=2895565 RepID=UPI002152C006|nr:isochorismatase family protein [Nocardioides sp. B-3]UUZ57885.1 isochorismatase family protein [Nocardioides sp. B-3]
MVSPGERLWSGLAVHNDDPVAEKTARSAFFPRSSSLPDLLSARDIDTIIVTGTVANVCVEASVRDAATLDHRVIVIGDAVAAMRDRDLNATLHTVYRSYGDVRSTAEVLDMIRVGS